MRIALRARLFLCLYDAYFPGSRPSCVRPSMTLDSSLNPQRRRAGMQYSYCKQVNWSWKVSQA